MKITPGDLVYIRGIPHLITLTNEFGAAYKDLSKLTRQERNKIINKTKKKTSLPDVTNGTENRNDNT